MCWIPLAVGILMIVAGVILIARFYLGRAGAQLPAASFGPTQSLIVGVMLTSIGTLVAALGVTGAICTGLGVV
jgi:hypothetical protein